MFQLNYLRGIRGALEDSLILLSRLSTTPDFFLIASQVQCLPGSKVGKNICALPLLVNIDPSSPLRNFADVIMAARMRPGKLQKRRSA